MEVVPTSDGEEDDGVIWFRCPQCQGFLPKLSGAESGPESGSAKESPAAAGTGQAEESPPSGGEASQDPEPAPADTPDDAMPWDSPADMMKAREASTTEEEVLPDLDDAESADLEDVDSVPAEAEDESDRPPEDSQESEPIHKYVALLAETDQSDPVPYRPWETYEVGQCIHHQAWEDCGIVLAKEDLPGGRQVIKCFFAEAGVVRLIEKAPR